MSKVWLITGSANGLGYAIAEQVLQRGDRLVATARNTDSLEALRLNFNDQLVTAKVDVTDPVATKSAIELAVTAFGQLDVVVNNAGFAATAPFEQMPDDIFKMQMETNFYGVVNLTRDAIPLMRKQKSGCIINISSGAGRMGAPGMSAYHAAKFAVGGFTESVAKEVRDFGVNIVAVEPGSMPTNWAALAASNVPELLDEYQSSVGHLLNMLNNLRGKEIGDLKKYAEAIYRIAYAPHLPNHILLGSDALFAVRAAQAARDKAEQEWQPLTVSTDSADADLSFLQHIPLD